MKLYLFLRSLVWTSILAVAFTIAMLVVAFIGVTDLVIPFGFAAVVFAALGGRGGPS